MRVVLAGEGAIARRHLAAIDRIDGVDIVSLAGGIEADTGALAAEHGIGHWSLELAECLARPGVAAAILATPTHLHAAQAIEVLRAGRHVLVEIPMADNLTDAAELADVAQESGRVAMVCHTRRFNPSHQWMRQRFASGGLHLQHLVAQTYFFRRTNTNALGRPRTWTDHLLWHHACHTVDLFQHQTGETAETVSAVQGPPHPELGIAMDMSISLTVPSGAVCSLALSFNNDGPFGTDFRYVCDNGTFVARYDDLVDGRDNPIDVSAGHVSTDGIELQDREFFASILEGREPESSVRSGLEAMRTLHRLEQALAQ